MEAVLKDMTPNAREEAKLFIFKNEVPQLFESLTAGLLHHRPEHPVEFVQDCLDSIRPAPGQPSPIVKWNTFIEWRPAPNSRSVSRLISAKSEAPRSKSCVSTADSGIRDISSASTAGRSASLSASSHTRVQVTPEVPAEKPASGDDKQTSGSDPSPDRALKVGGSNSLEGNARLTTDSNTQPENVKEENEDETFDPTDFEPPNM